VSDRLESDRTERPAVRDNRPLLEALARDGHIRLDGVAELLRRPSIPLATSPAERWPRIEGMLLALAIGDSLGNTTESQLPSRRRASHGWIRDYLPNHHAGGRAVGLPSDDTQLAFWTLECMLADDGVVPERLAERFCRERIFGIGGTVRDFIHAFKVDGLPWHEAGQPSAGNGALMRIAPVIVPHVARGDRLTSALSADAALAAKVTHDDRTSTSACVAFAWMLARLCDMRDAPEPSWWLDAYVEVAAPLEGEARLRSRVPGDHWDGPLWRLVDTRVRATLDDGLPVLEACNGWYSGAFLLETLPTALYILAMHAHEPEEAMLRAVNDTKDNDTVAAIVGAALGALHGSGWIPARWRAGLLGRTGASDDGRVFALIEEAHQRWSTA
jgi:ADP-ribosyl-[dinitrogen reductase] hydrolase